MGLGFRTLLAALVLMLSFGALPTASGGPARAARALELAVKTSYDVAALQARAPKPSFERASVEIDQPACTDLASDDESLNDDEFEPAASLASERVAARPRRVAARRHVAMRGARRAVVSSSAPRGPPARA